MTNKHPLAHVPLNLAANKGVDADAPARREFGVEVALDFQRPRRRRLPQSAKPSTFEFNDSTQEELGLGLRRANPAISDDEVSDALRAFTEIARQYIADVRRGADERIDSKKVKQELRAGFRQVRRHLNQLASLVEPSEDEETEFWRLHDIAACEAKIMAVLHPPTEKLYSGVEEQLLLHGWPIDLDELRFELMSRRSTEDRIVRVDRMLAELNAAVDAARQALDSEPSGKGRSPLYSQRRAIKGLAFVWSEYTHARVMQTTTSGRKMVSPFAEFARVLLNAVARLTGTKPGEKAGCLGTVQRLEEHRLLPGQENPG